MHIILEEILWCEGLRREGVDIKKEDSPLCKEFKSCKECPVYQKTGWRNCAQTPHENLMNHLIHCHIQTNHSLQIVPGCLECEKHLKDLLEFLKSLFRETFEEKPSNEKTLKERIQGLSA